MYSIRAVTDLLTVICGKNPFFAKISSKQTIIANAREAIGTNKNFWPTNFFRRIFWSGQTFFSLNSNRENGPFLKIFGIGQIPRLIKAEKRFAVTAVTTCSWNSVILVSFEPPWTVDQDESNNGSKRLDKWLEKRLESLKKCYFCNTIMSKIGHFLGPWSSYDIVKISSVIARKFWSVKNFYLSVSFPWIFLERFLSQQFWLKIVFFRAPLWRKCL